MTVLLNNNKNKICRIVVKGLVQSVGFRPFIKNLADECNLLGFVRNLGSNGVEIIISSPKSNIEVNVDNFVKKMYTNLPELAEIVELEKNILSMDESELFDSMTEDYDHKFKILQSQKGGDSSGFVALPPDIAICHRCIDDLDSDERRNYSFTSCTNCGPRYSTIHSLPYDRYNTGFESFKLCNRCNSEYSNPKNRRFHAQTTCCINCGPEYTLYERKETWVSKNLDWGLIREELKSGKIFAIMGNSGTHFVANALDDDAIDRLRENRRKKSNKPFAVMMRDLTTITKYCYLTDLDKEVISSTRRPIVIVPTADPSIWDACSPGLDSLGVYLPYSGLHHNLFDDELKCLVFTSANLPGIPMPYTSTEVLKLEYIADFALTHNLKIIQRVDDSVIRSHGDKHQIIRRSRGFVPSPMYDPRFASVADAISLGSIENCTGAISRNGWFVATQHIGNVENLETLEFLKTALAHLNDLYDIKTNKLFVDLHPETYNRHLAEILRAENNAELYSIQHHLAHAASLALDIGYNFDTPLLTWVCDGFGYGVDGNAWGGEQILLHKNAEWERVGHLDEVSYEGVDLNAKYPARMALHYMEMLDIDASKYFQPRASYLFKNGLKELDYLLNRTLRKPNMVTSSCGRFLDACSIMLNAADVRTYRGEPAIRLEALADLGKQQKTEAYLKSNDSVVDVLSIFQELLNRMDTGQKPQNIARWVLDTLGVSIGQVSRNIMNQRGLNQCGFSGGVAYNKYITNSLEKELSIENFFLLHHKRIPPGDAGISLGQLFYGGLKHAN